MKYLECLVIALALFVAGCEKNDPSKDNPTIIHHVFNPPVHFDIFGYGDECDVYRDTFRLDLNNDAKDDLEFKFGKQCISCDTAPDLVGHIWLDGLSNSISSTALALNGNGGLHGLNTTSIIDSNLHWMHEQRAFIMSLPCSGGITYVNLGERYVVFYIEKNQQIYYGWLLINVEILKFTIKEYAISKVPGQSLGIGDH